MARNDVPASLARHLARLIGLFLVATTRVSVNPASVAAEGVGDTTFALTGAALGDIIQVGLETDVYTGVNTPHSFHINAADSGTWHVNNGNVAAGAAIDIAATNINAVAHRRNPAVTV